ncbi:MAG: M1 family metallopeptidase [Acidobacteriota bacterium]|nr:M1 family metallopeptidase [Acidobacteriota bacterium]
MFGDTTVQLKPLKDNFTSIELDAADLNFESVKLEAANKDLTFRVSGEKISIMLDKAYSPEDLISVRFKYTTKPRKGIYFVDATTDKDKIVRASQVWTQGEPEEAHHWFPSFDFPDDKATTEQFITVERGEIAIGNGELLETTENAGGTKTFHFKMPVPHSTYLVSFVVGTYSKVSDSYKNIPLGFYVYPERESVATAAFGKTKEMMRIYEELTGVNFPYSKYDQTIVANFNFGGMENITATTMADSEILLAQMEFARNNVEDLVSHELAHSWFGNLVTCKNWAELWLNEGFATYMEAAYREKMYGREDYLRKIKEDAAQFMIDDSVNRNRHGLFNQLARPNDSIFDTTTYQKGGAVIHTLRETVGTEFFWKAINKYLNQHKFQNVETYNLQKAMEESSGMKLDWFFSQWVYGAGFPRLNVRQIYNPITKTLNLTVTQTQKLDKITTSAFILPMEIDITTAKGAKNEKIEIKKRLETFSIKLDGKPTKITFDKDEKIPLKLVKLQPLVLMGSQ